jgi:hypothetical protein
MAKPLNLTPHMAAAVRSSLVALEFENATVQIDFDPIDVFVSDEGWIIVRDGPHGYEEHENLGAFEKAYGLNDLAPDLLALAYEMEAMCEGFLISADEEGNDIARTIWSERRDRCRAAIAGNKLHQAKKV